jgi:hypothetical protein
MPFDRQEQQMARERLRRNRHGTESASFAAQAIDLTRPDDRKYAAAAIKHSQAKSKSSWDWYDRLGEIHYGISRSAKVGGYADLGVYRLDKNGQIGAQVTTGLPGEIAARLYSPYGGQRGLVERFLTLMKIPADSYLIQCRNGGDYDGYDFVSADELTLRRCSTCALATPSSGSRCPPRRSGAKPKWVSGSPPSTSLVASGARRRVGWTCLTPR